MQFDYDSILQRILASLQSKVSWANILEFSSNKKILEVFAKEASELINYDNYLTRENQWALSKNISSLLSSSDILGYKVHRKLGSKGTLTVSPSSAFNQGHGLTIMVPKFSMFSSADDSTVKFCTTANDSIPINVISKDINVIQGTPKSFTQTALGTNYEEIVVYNSNIEDTFYEVYVNGTLWAEVDNLLNALPTDQEYEIKNLYNFAGVRLKFGNNVFGKKLVNGDTVVFNYIDTLGSTGNVARIGAVSVVESTIYDSTPTQVSLYCKNAGSLDGGSGIQDIEDVRLKAPKIFQAGGRAVTKDDYKTILENSGFVYKTAVWGEYEYLIDHNLVPGDAYAFVPLQENKVHIAGLKNTGEPLDVTDQANIISYLGAYKPPTDIIEFNNPEIVYLHFISSVYVKERSYSLTAVKTSVLNTLSSAYSFQAFDFGTNIYETDYKTLIDNVTGVDHNYTVLRVYNIVSFDQATSASFLLSLNPIDPTSGQNVSVAVYLKNLNNPLAGYTMIGQDDGNGNIVGITTNGVTYTLTGSAINYANGVGSVKIVSPASGYGDGYLNYQLKIEYRVANVDFVLTSRAQIFRFGEAEVTCYYLQ
jgi:hypothetical protein